MGWKNFKGDRLAKKIKKAAGNATKIAADVIGEEADQQVPLDEGTLQASQRKESEGLTTALGYGYMPNGGKDKIPYARKWHELPANFQHGRKHNYLRDPVNSKGVRALTKALANEFRKL